MSRKPSATIRYTAMRLGIFVGCLVLVAGLNAVGLVPAGLGDANPAWLVLLALVISAPLSFVLLRKQRDEMSEQISGRVSRREGEARRQPQPGGRGRRRRPRELTHTPTHTPNRPGAGNTTRHAGASAFPGRSSVA